MTNSPRALYAIEIAYPLITANQMPMKDSAVTDLVRGITPNAASTDSGVTLQTGMRDLVFRGLSLEEATATHEAAVRAGYLVVDPWIDDPEPNRGHAICFISPAKVPETHRR